MTGQKFGMWTILSLRSKSSKVTLWDCQCECGKKVAVRSGNLRNGASTSCGCESLKRLLKSRITHGETRGGIQTSEYQCWVAMKQRVFNKNHVGYKNYGGRGIAICERWLNSFEDFIADMGRRPTPKHSIERVENDGNYEPSNCVWGTKAEQINNTRSNNRVTVGSVTLTVSQWAKRSGLKRTTISGRMRMGWSKETAVTTPTKTTWNRAGRRAK